MSRILACAAAALTISLFSTAYAADEGEDREKNGEEKEILLPNGLATAKVGDWVLYEIPDGYTQKMSVVKREGEGAEAEVTVRVENILDGEVVEFSERKQTAGEPMAPLPTPADPEVRLELASETITIGDKEYKGYSVNVTRGEEWLHKWYIAPEIPVYGLVRRETKDGKENFSLLEFHKADAEAVDAEAAEAEAEAGNENGA